MKFSGFDWDEGNRGKCQKHGVSVANIETALSNRPRGAAARGRPIFVAFSIRERDGRRLIRPISARYMHDKERDAYGA